MEQLEKLSGWNGPFTFNEGAKVLDSQWYKDFDNPININGRESSRAYWNLIVLKGQVRMYARTGMIAHRGWKITAIKKYFGLSGNPKTLTDKLDYLHNSLTNNPNEN